MYTKKRILTIGLCVLLFLLALGITVYPLISTWYNDKHQSLIHTQYEAVIRDADNTALKTARQEAEAYNTAITPGAHIRESFSEEAISLAAEDYESLLNIAGDHIMGYIEVPRIDIQLPIYHGTDSDSLDIGVGHLLGSSLPIGGPGTHCALSAHSGVASQKLFSDLDTLEVGDIFYLDVLGERMSYQVDAINTVLPHDSSLLAIEETKDYCTLITCTPYGLNSHRLLVRGTRIPYEEAEIIEEEKVTENKEPISTWEQEYIKGIIIGVGIVIIIGCFFALRKLIGRRGRYEIP